MRECNLGILVGFRSPSRRSTSANLRGRRKLLTREPYISMEGDRSASEWDDDWVDKLRRSRT
jgi:hypothetical protein